MAVFTRSSQASRGSWQRRGLCESLGINRYMKFGGKWGSESHLVYFVFLSTWANTHWLLLWLLSRLSHPVVLYASLCKTKKPLPITPFINTFCDLFVVDGLSNGILIKYMAFAVKPWLILHTDWHKREKALPLHWKWTKEGPSHSLNTTGLAPCCLTQPIDRYIRLVKCVYPAILQRGSGQ